MRTDLLVHNATVRGCVECHTRPRQTKKWGICGLHSHAHQAPWDVARGAIGAIGVIAHGHLARRDVLKRYPRKICHSPFHVCKIRVVRASNWWRASCPRSAAISVSRSVHNSVANAFFSRVCQCAVRVHKKNQLNRADEQHQQENSDQGVLHHCLSGFTVSRSPASCCKSEPHVSSWLASLPGAQMYTYRHCTSRKRVVEC